MAHAADLCATRWRWRWRWRTASRDLAASWCGDTADLLPTRDQRTSGSVADASHLPTARRRDASHHQRAARPLAVTADLSPTHTAGCAVASDRDPTGTD